MHEQWQLRCFLYGSGHRRRSIRPSLGSSLCCGTHSGSRTCQARMKSGQFYRNLEAQRPKGVPVLCMKAIQYMSDGSRTIHKYRFGGEVRVVDDPGTLIHTINANTSVLQPRKLYQHEAILFIFMVGLMRTYRRFIDQVQLNCPLRRISQTVPYQTILCILFC